MQLIIQLTKSFILSKIDRILKKDSLHSKMILSHFMLLKMEMSFIDFIRINVFY